MATEQSKVLRRATAENSLSEAVSALAERFGVEVTKSEFPIRDPELKRIVEMEDLASTLNSIVESSEPQIDFSKMTKAELAAYAEENKIEGVTDAMTKAEMIEVIEGK